jgi:acyl carrier protein
MSTTVSREQIERRLAEALMDFGVESDEIDPEVAFEALDVDSLDLLELAQMVEEEYDISISADDMFDLHTIGQAIDMVLERMT